MAARLSAEKLPRYSLEFKQQAVRLTRIAEIEVQVVAAALPQPGVGVAMTPE